MTSPIASGGGGTHFEAKVVAHYLATILCQTKVDGLPPSTHAVEANSQQADFGSQLDDLVVKGIMEDNSEARLHLQIKIKILFTPKNREWKELIRKAWITYSGVFDKNLDRIGFAIGNTGERIKHCEEAIKWANMTTNGKLFIEKIEKKYYSHKYKREFIETIKTQIAVCLDEPITDEILWQFICSIVILPFDYEKEISFNKNQVLERIEQFLPPSQKNKINSIWDCLVEYCGDLIPAGGGATRQSLSNLLRQHGLPTGTSRNFKKDIEIIQLESQRTLDDISIKICGHNIPRPSVNQLLKEAVYESRVIYITGEPGTGKSAILKSFAIENEHDSPIFFLKDSRILSGGWSAHASYLAVSSDIDTLLFEFGTRGIPIVFVDGVDRVSDGAKPTVNDIVRSVVNNEYLSEWKVIFTLRKHNIELVKTWLDIAVLNQVSSSIVEVPCLDENELNGLVNIFPDSKQFLDRSVKTFTFTRNLFFLNKVFSIENGEYFPNSEVELLELWWRSGGSVFREPTKNQHQHTVLLELAKRTVNNPGDAVSTYSLDADILEDLKLSSVLKDTDIGISVVFTHDIYEDWVITKLMLSKLKSISKFLQKNNENHILERPLQLLALYLLESEESADKWKMLFDCTNSDSNLRTLWRRTVLVSSIRSNKSIENLNKIFDKPTSVNLLLLGELIDIIPTVEITGDALPEYESWNSFLEWYFSHEEFHYSSLIPQLLPLFQAWQNAHVSKNSFHCRRIGEFAYEWLLIFENARSSIFRKHEQQPFTLNSDPVELEKLEDSIRVLFLLSTRVVPNLVSIYLNDKISHPFQLYNEEKILACQVDFAQYVPREFVDYFLTVYMQHPKDLVDKRNLDFSYISKMLGVEDFDHYSPASPIQQPFLNLLNHHEQEGIRLIKDLCNHSISVWRWLYIEKEYDLNKRNPIPVIIDFPWATQDFWGDKYVYLWFRGVGGNPILRSALMALEYWAFMQVENGRSINKLMQIVVKNNKCVAVLGVVVSLCMAFPKHSIQCALPIVTCSHIVYWDIFRKQAEDSDIVPTNLDGDWSVHQKELYEVQRLNEKYHRKQNIASLFPEFTKYSDRNIVSQFKLAVENFVDNLPFEFEYQKKNQKYVDYLRSSMKKTSDFANPENWVVDTHSTDGVVLKSDPTSPKSTKNIVDIKCTLLISWSKRSLENNVIDEDFTIEESINEASCLYELNLFSQPLTNHDTDSYIQKLALVRIATVVSKYYDKNDWKAKLNWCFEIFNQAMTLQVADDCILVNHLDYIKNIHLVVAVGYSLLLRREFNTDGSMKGLLILASNQNEKVNHDIAKCAQLYANKFPLFYTVLIDFLVRQCISTDENSSRMLSVGTVDFNDHLLDNAIDNLGSGCWPTLPTISNVRIHKVFVPIIECLQVDIYFSNPILKNQILILTKELVEMAIAPNAVSNQQFLPNWDIDWRACVFRWCGFISKFLTAEEIKTYMWNQISNINNKDSIVALGNFTPAFMFHSIASSVNLEDHKIKLWSEITTKIFDICEIVNIIPCEQLKYLHSSAASILFCKECTVGPYICVVEENWQCIQLFKNIVERAIRTFGTNDEFYRLVLIFFKKGGLEFFPEPSFHWFKHIFTEKKHDKIFWHTHGLETVRVIKLIYDRNKLKLKRKHRKEILKLIDILIDGGVQKAELVRIDFEIGT